MNDVIRAGTARLLIRGARRFCASGNDTSGAALRAWLATALLLAGGTASAALTVTPITWDVVGLDSNRPLTQGPELFPAAARVCSDVATTDPIQVDFVWDNADTTWINTRPGSLATLTFDPLPAGGCVDAYF